MENLHQKICDLCAEAGVPKNLVEVTAYSCLLVIAEANVAVDPEMAFKAASWIAMNAYKASETKKNPTSIFDRLAQTIRRLAQIMRQEDELKTTLYDGSAELVKSALRYAQNCLIFSRSNPSLGKFIRGDELRATWSIAKTRNPKRQRRSTLLTKANRRASP